MVYIKLTLSSKYNVYGDWFSYFDFFFNGISTFMAYLMPKAILIEEQQW